MNMKKMFAVCFAFCACAVVAEEAPSLESALKLQPQAHYASIARKVANMLPHYHVTQKPLNDEISRRAWTNLVTMYDYNHAVFLQADLDRFSKMELKIDDALRKGDVSFVYEVHKTFVRRLDECVAFVTNYLESSEMDFSVAEEYLYNRKDAPWPHTVEARDEIWRKRIKNEMLAQILGKELDAEKNAKTNAVAAVGEKPEPTPKEALLNKYRHYLAWVLTELDENKVMERYLLSVAMAYDPHSGYMAPDSKEDFDMDMSLSLCGVGAVLSQSMDDGSLEIKEVMKGGPMAREGSIKAGDKIIGVGQGDQPIEDVVWKPMRKSIKKIRGRKNTKVVLEVTDKNGASRRKVPIIRDEIKLEDQAATGRVETVTLNGVSRKMGYVKLPTFYGTMDKRPGAPGYRSSSLDVAKWIAKFNTQNTDGMVLDLRGNGGGSLKEAVMLSALFVRPNPGPCPVVQIRETSNLYVLPTFPDQPTFAYRKPLVVLIDRHSASASEIVAGVLQDTGRALVLGDTQSHGKGTVQTVMPMGRTDYGSMKITTARFYRINGSSTQVKGVASDICLPSAFDDRTDIGEDKLPNALPWSRIEPVSYDMIWNMQAFVPRLKELSAARTSADPEWTRRLQVVKLCRDLSERRAAPLARAARKKMMKEERAILDEVDDAELGDEDVGDDREDEEQDAAAARKKDIVLTEAMNILSDLSRLTRGGEAPDTPREQRIPAWLQLLQGGRE